VAAPTTGLSVALLAICLQAAELQDCLARLPSAEHAAAQTQASDACASTGSAGRPDAQPWQAGALLLLQQELPACSHWKYVALLAAAAWQHQQLLRPASNAAAAPLALPALQALLLHLGSASSNQTGSSGSGDGGSSGDGGGGSGGGGSVDCGCSSVDWTTSSSLAGVRPSDASDFVGWLAAQLLQHLAAVGSRPTDDSSGGGGSSGSSSSSSSGSTDGSSVGAEARRGLLSPEAAVAMVAALADLQERLHPEVAAEMQRPGSSSSSSSSSSSASTCTTASSRPRRGSRAGGPGGPASAPSSALAAAAAALAQQVAPGDASLEQLGVLLSSTGRLGLLLRSSFLLQCLSRAAAAAAAEEPGAAPAAVPASGAPATTGAAGAAAADAATAPSAPAAAAADVLWALARYLPQQDPATEAERQLQQLLRCAHAGLALLPALQLQRLLVAASRLQLQLPQGWLDAALPASLGALQGAGVGDAAGVLRALRLAGVTRPGDAWCRHAAAALRRSLQVCLQRAAQPPAPDASLGGAAPAAAVAAPAASLPTAAQSEDLVRCMQHLGVPLDAALAEELLEAARRRGQAAEALLRLLPVVAECLPPARGGRPQQGLRQGQQGQEQGQQGQEQGQGQVEVEGGVEEGDPSPHHRLASLVRELVALAGEEAMQQGRPKNVAKVGRPPGWRGRCGGRPAARLAWPAAVHARLRLSALHVVQALDHTRRLPGRSSSA